MRISVVFLAHCRLAVVSGFVGVAVGACDDGGEASERPPLLSPYFNARDARTSTFCGCFHELLGHRDATACEEAQALKSVQRGCISGIFVEDGEATYAYFASPIECLTDAESSFSGCLNSLMCADMDGLDECIATYNEAVVDCPRLSKEDTEDFEKCLQI